MRETITDLINAFTKQKVLVVGDAILDTYTKGATDRICREAPVLILTVKDRIHQCGGAANTAINVAALGATAYFLSVVGKDPQGTTLLEVLQKNGVQTGDIFTSTERTTISKQRLVSAFSILLRVDEGTMSPLSPAVEKWMFDRFRQLAPAMDAIIFSDYGGGTITDAFIQKAAAVLEQCRKPVIVDAKAPGRFRRLCPWAVKPNYVEAQTMLHLPYAESSERIPQIMQQSAALFASTGARCIAVTLDADGVILFEKDRQPFHIPAVMQDNARAIGAGDTFTATMALSLACGASSSTMAELAAMAAAVVVRKNGTAVCTPGELHNCYAAGNKYTADLYQLQCQVRELKEQGKRIVFTNGCFDILHKGHIALLQQARLLGDVLIVGLNTDDSIRLLKGPGRPINTLKDRIAVLSGLQSVDIITSFAARSPVELLQALQPNVFVKGGNWSETAIPEAELLKQLNCEIKIIPTASAHSTTRIIKKILRKNAGDRI